MIEFVNQYGRNYLYSQNGEEGILLECFRRMEIAVGYSVEIGGHNGKFCSNTALLLERGWSGLFVEADFGLWQQCRDTWKQRPDVRCACSRVDKSNVNAFVDERCDLLSIDTDGADYEIFKGLVARPKIVIVEIDSSIPPDEWGFNSDGGASFQEMCGLAYLKNYSLLCHTGNLVLVDERYKSPFPEVVSTPRVKPELYFNRGWLKTA